MKVVLMLDTSGKVNEQIESLVSAAIAREWNMVGVCDRDSEDRYVGEFFDPVDTVLAYKSLNAVAANKSDAVARLKGLIDKGLYVYVHEEGIDSTTAQGKNQPFLKWLLS